MANFLNHPTTRLIHPAKNEIGRINKQILDQINSKLCEILKVNEWKNTASVINWFKKIESKSSHQFLMFDIKDFYPSIKEGLLIEALEFAKQHVTIKSKDRETIFHARKSLLYKENHGLKNKAIISMLQWDHTTELRYVNLSVFSC